jgi:hypothetical protein
MASCSTPAPDQDASKTTAAALAQTAALDTTAAAKAYETSNGIPGKGGSIEANAITAANGTLLVTSGYGQFGEIPGNVLLAFKPKK